MKVMIVMEDGDMRFKAFSLIELMVILAIITIIATASIPQVQMWTARNRGIQAVSQIISDFSKTRSIAGYTVVSDLGRIEYESGEDAYIGIRLQTAIMYRKSNYSILQKSSMITADWSDDIAGDVLKKTVLPKDVTIEVVNSSSTSDSNSNTPVITITSNGKIKDKNSQLIHGSSGEECAGLQSPINNKVLVVLLKSMVGGSTTNGIWYRVEIDQTGEYFVCSVFGINNAPDFNDDEIANVLEI